MIVDRPNPGGKHEAPINWRQLAPRRKVAAAGLGGAAAVLIVWVIGLFGVELPPEVAGAITTVVGFAVAYLVPAGG